jgi:hypothetical protein
MKNIIGKSKIIAEFMGYKVNYDKETDEYSVGGRSLTSYNYHGNWNSLMPVIEKIESLDLSDWYDEGNFMNVNVSIESGHCYIFVELNYDPPHRICGESNYSIPKIELIYNQVVNFIEWYNKPVVK